MGLSPAVVNWPSRQVQMVDDPTIESVNGIEGGLERTLKRGAAWFGVRPSLIAEWAWVAGRAILVISAGIGVVFGLYPAWRAARLHPIDALRYE